MHSRLSQIMGIHSNAAIFGNVGIIAIGDFYQCAPVASSSIYSSMLWSDHFEQVELSINERQKNGGIFPQLLNRIRKVKKKVGITKSDQEILQKCHQRYLNKEYHREALHLFAKNVDVDGYNEKMIHEICTDIRTFHEIDRNGQEIKPKKGRYGKMLHVPLRVAKDARVTITKNVCVSDGLANGVTGRVVSFVEQNGQVSRILIKCDSPNAGHSHRSACSYCRHSGTICLTRENDCNDRDESQTISNIGGKQFPLRLSWAMTIHKAQGSTVDVIVVSSKDLFCSGMGYTALSRVRTIEGLFLIDLHFDKFYCDEKVEKILSQMKPMDKQLCVFRDGSEFVNILFHNIEGLSSNFKALTSHYMTKKAHLICLAETWLENNNRKNELEIADYKLIHRTRYESFSATHRIHSMKRGGIGIYIRNNISVNEITSPLPLNLEHVVVEIPGQKLIIISCYRTPYQSKIEFIQSLKLLLHSFCSTKRLLLFGDLNENSFQSNSKTIDLAMRELGFINICRNLSTTKDWTSLDSIYTNFFIEKDYYPAIIQTFYSFHKAITISVDLTETTIKPPTNVGYFDNIHQMEIDISPRSSITFDIPKTPKSKRNEKCHETSRKKTNINSTSYTEKSNNGLDQRTLNFLSNLKDILSNRSISFKSRSRVRICEQLALLGLRKINVVADGNCFFRALSYQLTGDENNHMDLRNAAIGHLTENSTQYAPFVAENYDGIEDYIIEMSRNGTYADHLSILATATSINQNIIIHELGKTPLFIPGSDYIEHQLHVFYDVDNVHYERVCQLDGERAFLSFEDLQDT